MKTLLFILIFLQIAEISFSQCTSGDCKNGFGTYQYSNSTYTGHWRNGKRNGTGIFKWNNGDSFDGEWIEDQKVYGKYVWPKGSKSIGQWKNNELDGLGYQLYSDGEAWFGEFLKGSIYGFAWKFLPSGEISFWEGINNRFKLIEKANLPKIDFELKDPEPFTYYVSKVDPIKPLPNDLEEKDKNSQIQVLNSYFFELKKYQSNLKVDFDKELKFSKSKLTELEDFINHAPDFNDLLYRIISRKEEQLDSMFNENKLIIEKINATSSENGYTASIASLNEKYEECNLKNQKTLDPLIGQVEIVDVHSISTVSPLTYSVIPTFKKNKKGQIEKLKWQIDSLTNQINILKIDHYSEVNPILVAIDINLQSKDDIIDLRKNLFNEYACIRMKCFDALEVIIKNKQELNNSINNEEITTNSRNTNNDQELDKSIITQVKIGNQIWMTQNLNVDKFRNGDPIPEAKTSEDWRWADKTQQPAWCYVHNETAKGVIYGKLYNWYAVNDPRGLAPQGWHIPGDDEWLELRNYLGGRVVAGPKLKSLDYWDNICDYSDNSSGFSGRPGGFRYYYSGFNHSGIAGYWWASDGGSDWAWTHSLNCIDDLVRFPKPKGDGQSVRCVKD
jgi:uncharacterized protein (TIGR02145 family)